MRPFDGVRVLVGVAGGIAAYKTAELIRQLVRAGAEIDVILTDGGSRFIGPMTLEGLTNRPVRRSLWEGGMTHLELGAGADAIVVAPATADVLARLASGLADDLLTTTLLAAPRRALLAPAMNYRMWEHPATRRNMDTLREHGHRIVGPDYGELAEHEVGWGRMAEPEAILAQLGRELEPRSRWLGRRVVVTAGPTREPVDPVRFLGNRSSGRMGYALAAAAWRRGAEVALVTGPTRVPVPPGLEEVHRIETAAELSAALGEALAGASALFMVAAVADFRPRHVATEKVRREQGMSEIDLEAVPDVLAEATAGLERPCLRVAFAVEAGGDAVEVARRKLERKGADLIVVNDISDAEAGFEVETNRVTILAGDGEPERLPLMLKTELADEILDRAEPLLPDE